MTIPYRAHPPLAVLRALGDKSLITFPAASGAGPVVCPAPVQASPC